MSRSKIQGKPKPPIKVKSKSKIILALGDGKPFWRSWNEIKRIAGEYGIPVIVRW